MLSTRVQKETYLYARVQETDQCTRIWKETDQYTKGLEGDRSVYLTINPTWRTPNWLKTFFPHFSRFAESFVKRKNGKETIKIYNCELTRIKFMNVQMPMLYS